jgi:putative hydrolase of the HAD superfamily
VKAVIFDLDDTLYPELDFVRGGLDAAAGILARRHGLDRRDVAGRMMELLLTRGRGRVFDTIVEELELGAPDRIVPLLLYVYRAHEPRLAPYPDVVPVLRRLNDAGLRIGVLTDGLASVQRRKLDALRLEVPLDPIVFVGELPSAWGKPSAESFAIACDLLDIAPAEITYVGNDPYKDFAGAREVGMRTIRVRAPSATFPVIAGAIHHDADRYIDPFDGIVDILLREG